MATFYIYVFIAVRSTDLWERVCREKQLFQLLPKINATLNRTGATDSKKKTPLQSGFNTSLVNKLW